jgi:prophage regulatory protein
MISTEQRSAQIRILRLRDVCKATGLCRSIIYELEADGAFPKRVRLTERTVGWVEDEVQSWLNQRVLSREIGKAAPLSTFSQMQVLPCSGP